MLIQWPAPMILCVNQTMYAWIQDTPGFQTSVIQEMKVWNVHPPGVWSGLVRSAFEVFLVSGSSTGPKRRWPRRVWQRSRLWFLSGTLALNTGEAASPWCWRTANRAMAPCSQRDTTRDRGVRRPECGVSPWRWKASRAENTRRLWGARATWGNGGWDRRQEWERSSGEADAGGGRWRPGRHTIWTRSGLTEQPFSSTRNKQQNRDPLTLNDSDPAM